MSIDAKSKFSAWTVYKAKLIIIELNATRVSRFRRPFSPCASWRAHCECACLNRWICIHVNVKRIRMKHEFVHVWEFLPSKQSIAFSFIKHLLTYKAQLISQTLSNFTESNLILWGKSSQMACVNGTVLRLSQDHRNYCLNIAEFVSKASSSHYHYCLDQSEVCPHRGSHWRRAKWLCSTARNTTSAY